MVCYALYLRQIRAGALQRDALAAAAPGHSRALVRRWQIDPARRAEIAIATREGRAERREHSARERERRSYTVDPARVGSLTPGDVAHIRALYADPETYWTVRQIAEIFSVSPRHVVRIAKYYTWRGLP